MKNLTLQLFLTISYLFTGLYSYASDENSASKIVIEVTINDRSVLNNSNKKEEVILYTSTFASNLAIAPTITYSTELGDRESYKFVIPNTSDKLYVNIGYKSPSGANWYSFENVYTFYKGDSVHCDLLKDFFIFSGKGAEKLNCQSEIFKYRDWGDSYSVELSNSKQYSKFHFLEKQLLDSLLSEQILTLGKYKKDLDKPTMDVLLANCYGFRYFVSLRSKNIDGKVGLRDKLLAFLNSPEYLQIDTTLHQKMPIESIISSPIYCDFLFSKLVLDYQKKSQYKPKQPREVQMKGLYDLIRSSYSGLIEEKLITMFCLAYKNSQSVLDFVNESLLIIKDKEYISILQTLKDTMSKGVNFFAFELSDDKGNLVKLEDLKDRTMLIDFWFTGCENCLKLHAGMKPIKERYKTNSKVVFVSVSVDKSKTMWLKSIESGKYTDRESINLYTGGLGMKHPLISYYNITGYPAFYIVNNGKLFLATPTRPNVNSAESQFKLISEIDDALKQLEL